MFKRLLFSLAILLPIFSTHSAYAAIFYVTPNGAGMQNGTSWTDAAPGINLQSVINNALPGDEVWVACGTYFPTTGTDRSISFSMRNGVAIYGSFQGNESTLQDRVFPCGPCSSLSGEINAAGNADNSWTVIWNEELDSTAILDGFIIEGGNDDRTPTSSGQGLGGGVYNHGFGSGGYCHATYRNLVFQNNSASWGGGAFNNGYNQGNSEPTYINCIFDNNYGYVEAGGLDSYGVGGNASPTIINTLFINNSSATNVGAMYAWGGNSGGNCHPVLINCAFVNNTATNGYGGAFIADNLDENGSTSSGSCTVTLQNCILWANQASNGVGPQFYVRGTGAQVLATYSDIDTTGQTSAHPLSGPNTGNLYVNPEFNAMSNGMGTDNCWMTADDGLALQSNSPCIDAGDNNSVHTSDLIGNPRIDGNNVDIGPYEFQVMTGFDGIDDFTRLIIYPNPVENLVKIQGPISQFQNLQLLSLQGQIVDINGRIIQDYYFRSRWRELQLDLGELPKGMYLLRTESRTYKISLR